MVLVGLKTPAPQVEAEVHRLLATLTFGSERLGQSDLAPTKLYSHSTTLQVPFPIGPRALSYISDGARSDDFAFKLELYGLLRARRTGDAGSFVRPDRPLGEWGFEQVGPIDLGFTVPRSEWFSKVVTLISDARFITVEMEVPEGSRQADLKASLELLAEAETATRSVTTPACSIDAAERLRRFRAIRSVSSIASRMIESASRPTPSTSRPASSSMPAGTSASQDLTRGRFLSTIAMRA